MVRRSVDRGPGEGISWCVRFAGLRPVEGSTTDVFVPDRSVCPGQSRLSHTDLCLGQSHLSLTDLFVWDRAICPRQMFVWDRAICPWQICLSGTEPFVPDRSVDWNRAVCPWQICLSGTEPFVQDRSVYWDWAICPGQICLLGQSHLSGTDLFTGTEPFIHDRCGCLIRWHLSSNDKCNLQRLRILIWHKSGSLFQAINKNSDVVGSMPY